MEFGEVAVAGAAGAVLAHSLAAGGVRLRKGHVLAPEDVARLAAAGVSQVTVARPGPDDMAEDDAAAAVGGALVAGEPGLRAGAAATGRVNLYARDAGLLAVDAAAVTRLNLADPSITLATLPPLARVVPGKMVATVKIIPYAVPRARVDDAVSAAGGALRLHPVVLRSAALIQTETPGAPPHLAQKGRESVAARLSALGITLAHDAVVPHEVPALAAALDARDEPLILVLTGSATSDVADVAPRALERAGGHVARFGIPVDPGNLVFLGQRGNSAVIGLPGSIRSPVPSGADWILERVVCGMTPGPEEIAALGVGGLLKEGPERPHPREGRRPR
ncbi:MAG: molybdopterin biosynthesis protein [Alphaproteobacteria bacterium HGW-Alphaproteobacteria-2]|nr:MAG: molybdopterin biosynthesis protein [Alphaproteobacteria bacterium HGW-Alphaproteobacteria-2]